MLWNLNEKADHWGVKTSLTTVTIVDDIADMFDVFDPWLNMPSLWTRRCYLICSQTAALSGYWNIQLEMCHKREQSGLSCLIITSWTFVFIPLLNVGEALLNYICVSKSTMWYLNQRWNKTPKRSTSFLHLWFFPPVLWGDVGLVHLKE